MRPVLSKSGESGEPWTEMGILGSQGNGETGVWSLEKMWNNGPGRIGFCSREGGFYNVVRFLPDSLSFESSLSVRVAFQLCSQYAYERKKHGLPDRRRTFPKPVLGPGTGVPRYAHGESLGGWVISESVILPRPFHYRDELLHVTMVLSVSRFRQIIESVPPGSQGSRGQTCPSSSSMETLGRGTTRASPV